VLVRHLDWLMDLYQAEQILNIEMKHVVARL
jgi:hypothetical protein